MKVIDLLNKKANGETLPEKIKIYSNIYTLSKDYWEGMCFKYMYVNDFGNWCDENLGLTDEVETIEEDKKIEKIGTIHYCENPVEMILHHKIDEIIDKINSMEVK